MKKICLLFAVFAMFAAGFTAIPERCFATTQPESQSVAPQTDKMDINTADEALLTTLPGIGEKTAAAIVSYRKENGNFKTLDELEQVKGIGAKKLAKIRPYLQEI